MFVSWASAPRIFNCSHNAWTTEYSVGLSQQLTYNDILECELQTSSATLRVIVVLPVPGGPCSQAEVIARIFQGLPINGIGHLLGQDIDQMLAGSTALPAGGLDESLGLRFGHVGGQGENSSFGQVEPVRLCQVLVHAGGIDDHLVEHALGMPEGGRGGRDHLGQGQPFQHPTRSAPLVFLDLGLMNQAEQPRVPSGQGDQNFGADGV